MEIHGRTPPISSFTDTYSVPWPISHVQAYFQMPPQQPYNARQTVEAPIPHYVPTVSVRDHPYGHYGIRQPEVARYPESSQRTALEESTTPPMYHFASDSTGFPSNRLRRLTGSDTDRREADVRSEGSIACESPAGDCESDNFSLGGHPSRFTQIPTSHPPLSSPTAILSREQFAFQQFCSDSPRPSTDASPTDTPTREVSVFVGPIVSTANEFNSVVLPLTTSRPSPSPSPLYGDQNSHSTILDRQMRPLHLPPADVSDIHTPGPPFARSNDDLGRYHSPDGGTEYNYNSAHVTPSPPLPPLSTPGLRSHWSESSLSTAFREENSNSVAPSEANSPPASHSGSESSVHTSESTSSPCATPIVVANNHLDRLVAISPRRRAKKKNSKKSKMHECGICHKQFPRPSGLETHQNSHSGRRPFNCSYPGCPRLFTVRSNAKRHLRTHGIFPDPSDQVPGPSFAGFHTPIISDSSHQVVRVTTRLKWIPHSLSTRSNAAWLKSASNTGEDKGGDNIYSPAPSRPLFPAPLPPVLPSFPTLSLDDESEERNSLAEAGSQPYHPTQWRGLPGPAVGLRTTQAAV